MPEKSSPELIGAYVPVLHRGYLDLFDTYPEAEIGVFDKTILEQFDDTRKDIRALQPELATQAINGLGRSARLLSHQALSEILSDSTRHVILAEDTISRTLVEQQDKLLAQVSFQPVFLRWDRAAIATNQEVIPDRTLHEEAIPEEVLKALNTERHDSTNWWRHVSAVITKGNTVLTSEHNQSLPTDYTSYIEGDPRITASRGNAIDTSLDIHAESNAIAQMARKGTSLEGAEIYVSTFPCPNCAKLIAMSGIRTCYFIEGYAMLDGYSVLKSADIEIVKIEAQLEADTKSQSIPYKKKNN